MHFAEADGAYRQLFPEGMVKIGLVLEAALAADILDGQVGVDQQGFRHAEPALCQVLENGLPGHLLKDAA